MTQSIPPATPVTPDESFDAPAPPRPKPWSIVSTLGFILSFLFVLAPIGIVLGIVGIVRTGQGIRRGRGLAIAAIPIGLGMSAFSIILILIAVMALNLRAWGPPVETFLRTSRSNLSEGAAQMYEQCSPRFKVAVSQEQFVDWAMRVNQKHGTLQNARWRSGKWLEPDPDGDGTRLFIEGHFVNGPALITLTAGVTGVKSEIDDIEVDGVAASSSP